MLPSGVLKELRGFDAILLGAIGHPKVKPGILEKSHDEHGFNRFLHSSDRHFPDPVCTGDPHP